MSLFPSPHTVVHIARIIDNNEVDVDTGNARIVDMEPVVRRAQSLAQQRSKAEFDGDAVARTVTELDMAVSDPQTYAAGDQVVIDPQLDDDGNWVEGSGTGYRVNGVPSDSRQGPWPKLLKAFGGVVKLRRVT